ncbi:MAG: hypothetical protein JW953_03350 [Anaerolineae bacterium]|nr:hypothetical protein [Anaerolineae bacterium]
MFAAIEQFSQWLRRQPQVRAGWGSPFNPFPFGRGNCWGLREQGQETGRANRIARPGI